MQIIPEQIDAFRLRFSIDRIDLTQLGFSVSEMEQLMVEVGARLANTADEVGEEHKTAKVQKEKVMGKSKSENDESDSKQNAELKRLLKFKRDAHKLFQVDFFAMRNLMEGMTRPCLLDVKLGSVAYNAKKIAR